MNLIIDLKTALRKKKRLGKTSWWRKIACWIAADTLAKSEVDSWQCAGKKNWDYANGRADIQVPTSQFVHWLLRHAGKEVCVMDVYKKYPYLMEREGNPLLKEEK